MLCKTPSVCQTNITAPTKNHNQICFSLSPSFSSSPSSDQVRQEANPEFDLVLTRAKKKKQKKNRRTAVFFLILSAGGRRQ